MFGLTLNVSGLIVTRHALTIFSRGSELCNCVRSSPDLNPTIEQL